MPHLEFSLWVLNCLGSALMVLFWCVAWNIWKDRNNIMHGEHERPLHHMLVPYLFRITINTILELGVWNLLEGLW